MRLSTAPTSTTLSAVLLLLAATALPAPPAAAQEARPGSGAGDEPAAHPFYAQLLEEGIYTYHRGDPAAAAGDLRLAVFGLLEDPPLLAEGLAYLALAQQQAGEAEAARETLGRLIAVEDRFGTWRRLELAPEVRRQTEELLMGAVPEAVLAASPGFRALADEAFRRRIAAMEPRQRRDALAGKLEERPGEAQWTVALARAELEMGDTRTAARLADQVLADGGTAAQQHHPAAHCVLGLAAARNDDCATVVEHLSVCPRSRQEIGVAAELLTCQVSLESWGAARELLAALPPQVQGQRPVQRLARRIPEPSADGGPTGGGPTDGTPADGTPADGTPADGTPTDGGLPADALARLDEARRLLGQARRAGELEESLRIAREVADTHPGAATAQHLVGEIAYRASRWRMAADYYRRGGEPERPEQRFYMAVALFESGERTAAARVLEPAVPKLPRTPFVTSYVERILGPGAASGPDDR